DSRKKAAIKSMYPNQQYTQRGGGPGGQYPPQQPSYGVGNMVPG
ncbi:unnamed protein product, partial [Rotaria magnacalcarata]